MKTHSLFCLLCLLSTASSLKAVEFPDGAWKRHTIDNVSRGADGARLADVNGDGLPDLVTPWEEGGIVRVCLHPGSMESESPWPAVTVGRVASPEDAVFVDLDADGRMDVVSSCEGSLKSMFVHWAPKNPQDYLKADCWKTEVIPVTQGLQAWMFAMPLDVDRRHGIDLVVSSKGGNASVGWLQAPADARQLGKWKYHRLVDAGWVMSLVRADMNQDGLDDILFTDRKGDARGVKWLEHPGAEDVAGAGKWKVHLLGGDEHEVMFMDHADFNGDGKRDFAVATHQKEILLLQQQNESKTWISHSIPAPFQLLNGKSVRVGDIDLDGIQDFVHSTEPNPGPRKPGVTWLKRASHDDRSPRVLPISDQRGIKFDLLQLLDVDLDGDLDVITCEERDNLGLIWYENPIR